VDVYHPTQLRGVLSSILDVHIHLVTICRLLLGLITLSPPNTHREEALYATHCTVDQDQPLIGSSFAHSSEEYISFIFLLSSVGIESNSNRFMRTRDSDFLPHMCSLAASALTPNMRSPRWRGLHNLNRNLN
jgi:hypothetical protein